MNNERGQLVTVELWLFEEKQPYLLHSSGISILLSMSLDLNSATRLALRSALSAYDIYLQSQQNNSGLLAIENQGKRQLNAGGDITRWIDLKSEEGCLRVAQLENLSGYFIGEELGELPLEGDGPTVTVITDGLDGTKAFQFHSFLTALMSGALESLSDEDHEVFAEIADSLTTYTTTFCRDFVSDCSAVEQLTTQRTLLDKYLQVWNGFGHLCAVFAGSEPCFEDSVVAICMNHARGSAIVALTGRGCFRLDEVSLRGIDLESDDLVQQVTERGTRIQAAPASSRVKADLLFPSFSKTWKDSAEDMNTIASISMYLSVIESGDTYLEVTRQPKKFDLEPCVAYRLLREAQADIFDAQTLLPIGPEKIRARGTTGQRGTIAAVSRELAKQLSQRLQ